MLTDKADIYGIDCEWHSRSEDRQRALTRAIRRDPRVIVFYQRKPVTDELLALVRLASESGHAVMVTPDKMLAPLETNWLEQLQT